MNYSAVLKSAVVLALVSVAPISAASAAEPAMVSKVGGKDVTWQSGETSGRPRVQTLLSPGDRLAAGAGSFIEIEYLADNCKVRVSPGSSVTIAETSPCAPQPEQAAAGADNPATEVKVVPAAAGAVEVTSKEGAFTRLDRGDGLVDASVGDALKEGDEVFAGPNSSITLYFSAAGCSYTVPAGTVFKVTSQAPCKAPAAAQNAATPPAPPPAVPTAAIIGGGVAVAGAVAIVAVIANTDDGGNNNNNNPATPD